MQPILANAAYDAGYEVGTLIAVVALVTALVVLARRVRRSALAPPPAAAYGSALAPEQPVSPQRRTSDIVAICVVGTMLVVALLNFAGRHSASADSWSSAKGRNLKAGFVDGCTNTSSQLVDCGCLFDALRTTPAYNTPERFAALGRQLQSVGDNPNLVPPAYIAAVQSCAAGRATP